jgi:hypothetical protein
VFQECIELVRGLGIRYVWIDSLCIVQDDGTDWSIEAERMASIYENAFVTLSLHQPAPNKSSLSDPEVPESFMCFEIPEPDIYEPDSGLSPQSWSVAVGHRLRHISRKTLYSVDTDRLASRGWCFQASSMSTIGSSDLAN